MVLEGFQHDKNSLTSCDVAGITIQLLQARFAILLFCLKYLALRHLKKKYTFIRRGGAS